MWSRSLHRDPVRITFRADGDARIGLGHLSRCIALAEAFRRRVRCTITFLVNRPAFLRGLLPPAFPAIVSRPSPGARRPAGGQVTVAPEADILVTDLPSLRSREASRLRRRSRILVCIDDRPVRHPEADVVVRPNFGVTTSSTDPEAPVLSGQDYLILRESFRRRWRAPRRSARVRRMLLCFGGADVRGLTARVVEVLRAMPLPDVLRIAVILGPAFGSASPIRRRIDGDPRFELYRSVRDMARRLRGTDAAILSGGTLLYEALATGVPALILSQTAEQVREAARLAEVGALLTLPGPRPPAPGALRRALERLLLDPGLRRRLSAAAMRLADGRGSERIARAALQALRRTGR